MILSDFVYVDVVDNDIVAVLVDGSVDDDDDDGGGGCDDDDDDDSDYDLSLLSKFSP